MSSFKSLSYANLKMECYYYISCIPKDGNLHLLVHLQKEKLFNIYTNELNFLFHYHLQ